MDEKTSLYPYVLFLLPACGAIWVALFGKEKGLLREGVSFAAVALTLVFSAQIVWRSLAAGRGAFMVTAFSRNMMIDSFSAVMALLFNVMLLLILLYSFRYMKSHVDSGQVRDGRLRWFYSLVMAFDATMMLTVVSNNLIMLYISVEASTLSTALLVCFFRDRRGLEAAYKYIVLIVVGIAFALMGCVLLYASVVPHITGQNALLLTEIGKVVAIIPKNIAILSVACLMIGFSTKGGLIPFHFWLPDAHAEAPAPVSAMLSGLIIKVGAYAFARTVTVFTPTYPAVAVYVAAVACLSMVIAALLSFAQDDLKRLLAFSSISQLGYVFGGFGLATYLGVYGGLFHLLNHTILKTLLFLCAGALIYATGTRSIRELGGLSRKMPVTALCFFVGALGIGGMPVFNSFHSKFAIFAAFAEQKLWWAMAISVGTGVLTVAVFVWAGYRIFWGEPASDRVLSSAREIPPAMVIPMVVLAALAVFIGVYPQVLYPLLDSATQCIMHTWKGV